MDKKNARENSSNLPADPRLLRTRDQMKALDAFHITENAMSRGPLLLPEIPFSEELQNAAHAQLAERLDREPTEKEVKTFMRSYEAWKKEGDL